MDNKVEMQRKESDEGFHDIHDKVDDEKLDVERLTSILRLCFDGEIDEAAEIKNQKVLQKDLAI